ncbi:MAG: DUF4349 domain-containing protein [Clostridia bacterium]|nr:DUF4349 domain-containing protein [Clostridia bacterium]
MSRFKKTALVIFSLFMVAVMLCGCGQSADKSGAKNNADEYYGDVFENSDIADIKSEAKSANDSQSTGTSEQVTQSRKIIEYVNLTVETKKFDELIKSINSAVKKSGGYIENSQIGGNSYYGSDSRTAQLKIRIPKDKQSDFSDFMSENSNIVNRSVSTEDVTDEYIDTQSRIKALTIEKETLEKLLAQSANVKDTLTVYERLTDVIAEIESYQGKLNQMDNLIDYTTFTVDIEEVEKETDVKKQNWFTKTWKGFVNSLSNVGNGLLNFFSFAFSAIPYLILPAVVALVVVLIIRHSKKKRAKKE